jgi:hypothetical protein
MKRKDSAVDVCGTWWVDWTDEGNDFRVRYPQDKSQRWVVMGRCKLRFGFIAEGEALSVASHKPNGTIDLLGWSPKYFPPMLVPGQDAVRPGLAGVPKPSPGLRDQRESLWNSRLSDVAFLEVRGDVVERLVPPFLGFGEQLPAVLGMKGCSLTVQGFHCAAVNKLFHRHLPVQADDIVSPGLSRCHDDYATGRLPYRPHLDNLQ